MLRLIKRLINRLFRVFSINYNRIGTENRIIYGSLVGCMLVALFFIAINYRIFSILTWDIGFIDPSSSFAESLIKLYNYMWFYLFFVLGMVVVLLARSIYLFTWKANFFHFIFLNTILSRMLKFVLRMRHFFMARSKTFRSIAILNELKANKIKINIWHTNDKRYYDLSWRQPMKKLEKFLKVNDISEHKRLEAVWCGIPTIILLSIANPSIAFIYTIDPAIDPIYTIKIIGRQWYWNYSFDGYIFIEDYKDKRYQLTEIYKKYFTLLHEKNLKHFFEIPLKNAIHLTYNFDSMMKIDGDLLNGTHRLLEVDNRLVLPLGVPIRFVITSVDVIHSWAIPALGIKVDAVPGRLNQFVVEIKKPGIYFGQCSELCGPLHGFMPIVISVVPATEFENWLLSVGTIEE